MAKNIGLQSDTYEDLDDWKSPGQSFDGAVQELLNQVKKEAAGATA